MYGNEHSNGNGETEAKRKKGMEREKEVVVTTVTNTCLFCYFNLMFTMCLCLSFVVLFGVHLLLLCNHSFTSFWCTWHNPRSNHPQAAKILAGGVGIP